MTDSPSSLPDLPWQVGELLAALHQRIDAHFGPVRVEGEVSSFTQARSGHRYFALKDSDSQIRCAWFRHSIRGVPLSEGQKIVAHGHLAIYPQRGDLQLIVSTVEDVGEGALARAFAALKKRLESEGLFAAARKPPLPRTIRRIAIITSPQGAALQDVWATLRRRDPFMQVELHPVPVQGSGAVAAIVQALAEINASPAPPDVILLTRGGGSLEDLQAFNTEPVARAIAASALPVVSAVGHETDVSISDFVASLRAITPTAAAELLSLDRQEQLRRAQALRNRLHQQLQLLLQHQRKQWLQWRTRLQRQSPQRGLDQQAQRLDHALRRLHRSTLSHLRRLQTQLQAVEPRLRRQAPAARIQTAQRQLTGLQQRLQQSMQRRMQRHVTRLTHDRVRLNNLNPRSVLARGYALVHADDGLVTRAADCSPGDSLRIEWSDGERVAQVMAQK